MWRAPVVKTPAASEPITLADAKAHLRVDHADDDAMIGGMISASRAHVESVTGQRLGVQTLTLRCTDWSDLDLLPLAPVTAVISVKYIGGDGEEQTVPSTAYQERLEGLAPQLVAIDPWPHRRPGTLISVELTAGYVAAPPAIAAAIKLHLGQLYSGREPATAADTSVFDALLANHRIHLI